MTSIRSASVVAAAMAAVLSCISPASADFYDYRMPAPFPECSAPAVYSQIVGRFNWATSTTFHYGVAIESISAARERGRVSFGLAPVNRRYCRAQAMLSNGRRHTVHYRIEEGMGLAGTGWKVEFCLPGYDRWRVSGGGCRVLRR